MFGFNKGERNPQESSLKRKSKKINVGYMLFIMIYPMIKIGFEYK